MTEYHTPPRNSAETESYTARHLTGAQFDESWAIAGIIKREISKSGTFREKLGDYSYAFARSEKFNVTKAETIIRDQFKDRYGQSMNKLREELMEREEALDELATDKAHLHALDIGRLIKDGKTMPFFRAYDDRGRQLARELKITEAGAKKLMQDTFRQREGCELYGWGKAIEEEYHLPRREQEQKPQENGKARSPVRQQSR